MELRQEKEGRLFFPNLITALCRRAKVMEEKFNEVVQGDAAITNKKLPKLMGVQGPPAHEESPEPAQPAPQAPQAPPTKAASAKWAQLQDALTHTQTRLDNMSNQLHIYFDYVRRRDEVEMKLFEEMLTHVNEKMPAFQVSY